MAELPIITLPDPLLKQPSAKIETVDAGVLKLADDMLDTMYKAWAWVLPPFKSASSNAWS